MDFPYALPAERSGYDAVRFEDLYKVYVDGMEYQRGTANSIFEQTFFKIDNKVDVKDRYITPADLRILYFARPQRKTKATDTIKLPYEWIKLAMTYVRCEAYKEFNEFALANNWVAEYNAHLQDFSAWIQRRNPSYGL